MPSSIRPLDPPPALVLFDLDDTLCDYAGARAGRLRTAFGTALAHAATGAEVDLDRVIAESLAIHPHGSEHFGELLARYGVADPAVAQAARAWYQTNRFLGLTLFADAVEMLRAVRAALPGRRLGVITNGPAEVQRDKIALLDLAQHVDFTIISGEFGIAKPDPAIFEEGLRRGEATVEETVFIGDSPEYDILGARAAGLRAIWMNRTGLTWPAAPPPPMAIRSIAEVRVLLGAPPAGGSWARYSVGGSQMEPFGTADLELAAHFYQAIDDPGARAVLDFLIDHPDERVEGYAIANTLGLPRHRDVARATYDYGEVARSMGRTRPWQEAQLGYLMPAEQATLLRQARDRATSG